MTVFDVVIKLIGPVNPVGETNTDNTRYDNLCELIHVAEQIQIKLTEIANNNINSHEYSRKRAGLRCNTFLEEMQT